MKLQICLAGLCASVFFAWSGTPRALASEASKTKGLQTYEVRGVVEEIGLDHRVAVIRHGAIPGYMPAMTMEFRVLEPGELVAIMPRDEVTFRLVVSEDSHWIESVRRVNASNAELSEFPHSPKPGITPALKSGDTMPDHELLGENGRPVRFAEFRGEALAFTFIFTRCPLPDYCPRMSRNFEKARALLEGQAKGPTNWHFLSISFDSEFDQPLVLTHYARSYRGDDFQHWIFASASTNVLAQLSGELDLAVTRDRGGFSHNLRTVVLDTHGRVLRQFTGNKWTPEDLAESILQASRVAN